MHEEGYAAVYVHKPSSHLTVFSVALVVVSLVSRRRG